MKVRQEWGVLISQTGTEVIAISEKTGYLPGLVVTNNVHKIPERNMEILRENSVNVVVLPRTPTISDYLATTLLDRRLITLHGYLRILPSRFFTHCKSFIYNGHPALISKYPELKGLNKQEDIFYRKEKYPTCGSVIHEVIPELDSGKIVATAEVRNVAGSLDEAYEILRKTSLATWEYFFRNIWRFY